MTTYRLATIAAACLTLAAAAPVLAQPAQAEPGLAEPAVVTTSPFIGTWQLDVAHMPVTYGTPPKSVTYQFVDLGEGRWETRIRIVDQDDSVREVAVNYRRDGQSNVGTGYQGEGDNAAVNSPSPNVLVMSLARDRSLESVRVYAVSADGQEMTESAADVDDDGVPFVRNFHFTRSAGQ